METKYMSKKEAFNILTKYLLKNSQELCDRNMSNFEISLLDNCRPCINIKKYVSVMVKVDDREFYIDKDCNIKTIFLDDIINDGYEYAIEGEEDGN